MSIEDLTVEQSISRLLDHTLTREPEDSFDSLSKLAATSSELIQKLTEKAPIFRMLQGDYKTNVEVEGVTIKQQVLFIASLKIAEKVIQRVPSRSKPVGVDLASGDLESKLDEVEGRINAIAKLW